MTTEPNTNPTPETPAPAEAAAPAADRMRYVIPAVLSTLLTLVALAPVAYVINRNMPARVATVDLQVLVEEDQKRTLDVIGKGGDVTADVLPKIGHEIPEALMRKALERLQTFIPRKVWEQAVREAEAAERVWNTLLADERSAPGGPWHEAVRTWRDVQIRKLVRRADGKRWEDEVEVPADNVHHLPPNRHHGFAERDYTSGLKRREDGSYAL